MVKRLGRPAATTAGTSSPAAKTRSSASPTRSASPTATTRTRRSTCTRRRSTWPLRKASFRATCTACSSIRPRVALSLVEASDGKIGSPMDQILLFCFAYDHTAGTLRSGRIQDHASGRGAVHGRARRIPGSFVDRGRAPAPLPHRRSPLVSHLFELFAAAAGASGLLRFAAKGKTFLMPAQRSTLAGDVDGLFYFIYWISIFFFVLILGRPALLPAQVPPARPGTRAQASMQHSHPARARVDRDPAACS